MKTSRKWEWSIFFKAIETWVLLVESCLPTSTSKSIELAAAQGIQRGLAHLCGMQGPQRDHHLVVDAGAVIDLPAHKFRQVRDM